jgi:hypothetical protein
MAVSANPNWRALRDLALGSLKPLVKLDGVATDIGVSGARHLQTLLSEQDLDALALVGRFHCVTAAPMDDA